MSESTTPLAPSAPSYAPHRAEQIAWWVAFGVLTLSILVMLGAGN